MRDGRISLKGTLVLSMKPKKLTKQVRKGQQGINLIEDIVLRMGSIWNPHGIDVGIDGHIELCEPETGNALGAILLVQSRVIEQEFQAESEDAFEYLCSERELDYWLQGNAQVLLVISRPSRRESYWVSIKDYFRDPKRKASRRVRFEKKKDRFFEGSYRDLVAVAVKPETGLYLGPPRKSEALVSNLLQVASYAPRIYVASTELKQPSELFRLCQERQISIPREWLLKTRQLVSFHDLRDWPWTQLCDRGSVEDFDVEEYAASSDDDKRWDFVRLLKQCLRAKLYPRVIHQNDLDCYMFRPFPNMKPYSVPYQGPTRQGTRQVFDAYTSPKTGEITHYRHDAFEAAFRRLEGKWYLEINPTYVYTIDGERLSLFQSQQLSKIKRFERNPDVRRQVLTWATQLGRGEDLVTPPYPFLVFGDLVSFDLAVGIDDKAWDAKSPTEELIDSEQTQLGI